MRKENMLELLGKFFAFMLACTILSRASSSVTVAVVQTTPPERIALTHLVTAVGKVEENQEQAVSVEAGHKISRIYVQEGDQVEVGDVLLQLDLEALDEKISSCRCQMERLEWEIADLESAQNIQEEKKRQLLERAGQDYALAAEKGDRAAARAMDEWNAAVDRLNAYYASGDQEKELQEEGESAAKVQESALLEAVQTAQTAYEDEVAARQEELEKARRDWEDAQSEEPNDSTIRQKEMDKKEKKTMFRKLQKLRKAEGKISAPIKGVVTKLNAVPGEWTTESAPVLLADLSTGCRFVAQVNKEEEKYLEKGMPVTLTSQLKKQKAENLEIASIEINLEDPALLDVCVDLPAGVLEIGDSAQMTAERKSKTYDTCVPLQALHETNGMKFVYVLGEKDTILGKQLAAVKISVMIQEQNEQYAALADGSLGKDQKVIRDSSKTIDEGSPVRLEEL